MNERFSIARWWGVVLKEFLQLRRDRITFAMIIGIPIIQMTLFGFAINTDPKHLPTAVIAADQSEFTRSFIAALRNSDYFDIVATLPDEESGRRALVQGRVLFVVDIPPGFTRELGKGAHPALLAEARAADAAPPAHAARGAGARARLPGARTARARDRGRSAAADD